MELVVMSSQQRPQNHLTLRDGPRDSCLTKIDIKQQAQQQTQQQAPSQASPQDPPQEKNVRPGDYIQIRSRPTDKAAKAKENYYQNRLTFGDGLKNRHLTRPAVNLQQAPQQAPQQV